MQKLCCLSFLKKDLFDVDHFLKSLLNLLQYCFSLIFVFLGCEAFMILTPLSGIKPTLPALEGKVLTTGLPGKSQ